MAITRLDATEPGSSGYWLKRLSRVLDDRAKTTGDTPSMQTYRNYYNGDHKLAFSTSKFREAFGDLFSAYAENLCGVVVNSLVERLEVVGLRLSNDQVSRRAWQWWQRNGLDAEMGIGFREAAITGEINLLVGPPPEGSDTPTITIEDPLESVVVVDRRRRIVALKRWYDAEFNRWRAFVYYPDRIEKFWTPATDSAKPPAFTKWEPQEIDGEDQVLEHQLGVVAMVPMPHRPNLARLGMSELAEVKPIQDAINKLVADLLVASEFAAFPQRWATGIEIPIDPATGDPVDTFSAAVNRLWIGNPPSDADATVQARFGDFTQGSLTGYIEAIKQRLQMIATITRMPPHYLLGDPGQWPSGESLGAAETGLVAKAGDRARDYSDPIEEAFRLAGLMVGDREIADDRDSEVVWKDPRFRTESEHIDALVKERAGLGIPDEIVWEKVPYSPQEIRRIKKARIAQAREAAAAFDPDNRNPELTTEELQKRVDMYGVLIRSGVEPRSAADTLGLDLDHTGLLPVTVQSAGGAALRQVG